MREAGIERDVVAEICWNNPVELFSQSGRLDLETIGHLPKIDQTRLHEGNSVPRGQKPVIEP